MIRLFVTAALVAALAVGCTKTLSPEEKAQVQALRAELETTKRDAVLAQVENAKYSGGVLKAMTSLRLEVLKTNEALLEQRINAIETGAKVTVVTPTSTAKPDRAKQLETEISKQETKVTESEAKASVQGGLIGAMSAIGAATERNTLALLRQQYLIAKYGLALPQMPASATPATAETPSQTPVTAPSASTAPVISDDARVREGILDVTLLHKQFSQQDYQKFIFFDIAITAKGLDKPARAIKGALNLTDLFGERKFSIRMTLEKPLKPGETYTEKGTGFKFNQFIDSHQWVRSTDLQNMKANFVVNEILYQDGTTRKLD